MNDKNKLTELYSETKNILKECKEKNRLNIKLELCDLEKLANNALILYREYRPEFSKQMVKNRRCSPDTLEFYKHFHSVEDLLELIKNNFE